MSHAGTILAILEREAQRAAQEAAEREARHPELYAMLRRSHQVELRSAALIETAEQLVAKTVLIAKARP